MSCLMEGRAPASPLRSTKLFSVAELHSPGQVYCKAAASSATLGTSLQRCNSWPSGPSTKT